MRVKHVLGNMVSSVGVDFDELPLYFQGGAPESRSPEKREEGVRICKALFPPYVHINACLHSLVVPERDQAPRRQSITGISCGTGWLTKRKNLQLNPTFTVHRYVLRGKMHVSLTETTSSANAFVFPILTRF